MSAGPASSNSTRRAGSALSRFASTQPAAPAPTMMTSYPLPLITVSRGKKTRLHSPAVAVQIQVSAILCAALRLSTNWLVRLRSRGADDRTAAYRDDTSSCQPTSWFVLCGPAVMGEDDAGHSRCDRRRTDGLRGGRDRRQPQQDRSLCRAREAARRRAGHLPGMRDDRLLHRRPDQGSRGRAGRSRHGAARRHRARQRPHADLRALHAGERRLPQLAEGLRAGRRAARHLSQGASVRVGADRSTAPATSRSWSTRRSAGSA